MMRRGVGVNSSTKPAEDRADKEIAPSFMGVFPFTRGPAVPSARERRLH